NPSTDCGDGTWAKTTTDSSKVKPHRRSADIGRDRECFLAQRTVCLEVNQFENFVLFVSVLRGLCVGKKVITPGAERLSQRPRSLLSRIAVFFLLSPNIRAFFEPTELRVSASLR